MITNKEIEKQYKEKDLDSFVNWCVTNEIPENLIKKTVTKVEVVKTIKLGLYCCVSVIAVYVLCALFMRIYK